jgi:hypothetical protein
MLARAAAGVVAVALLAGSASADVKRRKTATALSGVGTGVSSALIVTSFFVRDEHGEINNPLLITGLATSIVTPSLGEWYGHQWLTVGMGVRAGAAALALFGATRTESVRCENGDPSQTCTSITRSGIAYLGLAAIAYVGGAAYDVAEAGEVVDRHDHPYYVSVTPMPSGGGLVLGGHF